MSHLVSDAVPALLSYVDTRRRYQFCNRAYTEWFGLAHEDIIGKTMVEVLGTEAWQVLQSRVDEVLSGRPTEFEVEAKYKTGGTRWIRVNYTPDRGDAGLVVGFSVMVTDITEHKRVEEALRHSEQFSRTIIESSRDCIKILGLDGTLLWMSNAGQRILCIDHIERHLGKSWLNLWDGQDRINAQNAIAAAAAGGSGTFVGQFMVSCQPRWWEVVVSPIPDASGRPGTLLAVSRDVTERKISEETLQRSEALLRKALATKTVGVLFFNLRGQITNANAAFEQMTGYTRDELKNTVHWRKLTAEEFLEVTARTAQSLADHGEATPYEKQMIRKDGSRWWGLFAPTRLVGTGADSECMEFIIDITERKRAESALRESEKRFRSFVEATAQVIWRTNSRGEVDQPIPSWCAFTGQSEQEVFGFGWMDAIHPSDRPKVVEAWQKASASKATYKVEYRLKIPSGEWRHILARGVPVFDTTGAVVEYIGACIDITDRDLAEAAAREAGERLRHGEATLRTVTNAAQVGLVMLDQDRRYIFANHTYAEILGLPDSNIVGRRLPDVLPSVYESQIKPYLDRAFAGERVTYELLLPTHPKTGLEHLYEVTYEKRDSSNGRFVVVVLVDITERKKAQDLLEHTVAQRTSALRDTNEQMEAFTYTIAHDLRAPLRAQQGFAHALLEEYGDALGETGREYTDRIIQSAARLNDLIGDLLAFSRISRTTLELHRTDLRKLILNICDEMTFQFRDSNAKVHIESFDYVVCGHELILRTSIQNLLTNAIKFTKPDVPPEVTIRAEARGKYIRLWVEDNGIGIAPEHQHQIFGVFHRLHKAGQYPGTGVGLAIVQKGIERMGGRVGVESKPGVGSRFWIELENSN